MGTKGDSVIGYKYYIGMHQVLCYGPIDSVLQLNVDKRVAWDDGASSSSTITVNAKKLFGGVDREGGVAGNIDIAMGESTQEANQYLSDILSPYEDDMPIPAFRGVLSLYLNRFYIGLNPYIKPFAWKLHRSQTGHDGATVWYSAKASVGDGLNAAHIIYECFVAKWGMKYPDAALDDTAFRAAADTLYDEGFGLSMQWLRQETIEEFTKNVLKYIDGRTFVDPVTGLLSLKLIRDDYVAGDLPLYDESNVLELVKFERRGWGETINEVTVKYTDLSVAEAQGEVKPVTIQNLANITQQGRVVNATKDYTAVTSPSLAGRLAQRDVGIGSAPLSSLSIKVNREAWNISPGEVFRFSWPKEDISEAVFRVGDIDWGEIDSGEITISAVEDHFTMPSGSYWEEQPYGWNNPNSEPPIDTVTTQQDILELPYYEVIMRVKEYDYALLDPSFGFIGTQVKEPHGSTFWYGYNLYTAANNDAPPTIPPGQTSGYDYEIDLSTSNHMDGAINANSQLVFKCTFPAEGNQRYVQFTAVTMGGSPCFRFTVLFYNYGTDVLRCSYENASSVATDSQYTDWVVARNEPFYLVMHNDSSGSGNYRLSWSSSPY